jgi:hypothetical protein
MMTIFLPDVPVSMRSLVEATAAATVPDLHKTLRMDDEDAASVRPVEVSLRRQAEQMHSVALAQMVTRGEIVARSTLYRTPYPDFDINHMDKCSVAFADAQKFCRSLEIELQPEAAAMPAPAETEIPSLPAEMREPMRRLAALRALDGSVSVHGRVKGLAKLAQQEKGKPNSSSKTLRKQLKEAAQWEHDQKRSAAAFSLS